MKLWTRIKGDMAYTNCLRETAGAGIFGLLGGSFYPFLGIYLVHIGGNAVQLGILGCAPFLGNLAAPYWAKFAQKLRLVPYITVVLFTARLVILPIGFIKDPWIVTLMVLLHFIMASMTGPAYNVLLRDIYPKPMRGRAMSVVRFVLAGSQAVALMIAGYYYDQHVGWLFFIGGCMGIIALIPFSRIRVPVHHAAKPSMQETAPAQTSLFAMLKTVSGFGLFLSAFLLFEIGIFLPLAVYPVYQVNELHLQSSQVAVLGTLWMAALSVTYPIWGYITDRAGPVFCLFFGFLLQLSIPLAYALTDSLWILGIASILGGCASSAIDVAWINMLMRMSEKNILQTSSIHMQLSGVRGAVLPLVGSLMASSSGETFIFALSSLFIGVSLIPAALVYRKVITLS